MSDRIVIHNTTVAGRRPAADSRPVGELWVNLAERVLGIIDQAGNPVDLTIGAIPPKPSGEAAMLIVDPSGFPAWLEIDSEAIVAQPAAAINQTIQVQSPSGVPLTLKGTASQVADLFRVRSSANARHLDVSAAGITRVTGPGAGMFELSTGSVTRKLGASGDYLTVDKGLRAETLQVSSAGGTRTLSIGSGALVVDGTLRMTGDAYVEGNVEVDANASDGSAQIRLNNHSGGTRRGLVYAAADGSYLRLLKYAGGTTDVYLNLVSADCRLESASSSTPSGNSLITASRGDDRYLRPHLLDDELAGLGTGTLGTYALMKQNGGGDKNAGDTTSGSNLNYVRIVGGGGFESAGSPNGNWRCMGRGSTDAVGLWMRYT